MRGRQHAWTPIVLHWRRRRALVQPARPLLLRSHCAIHNVHNSTSLHIWQLTAATINRSFERVTTLIRTMRENTAPLFASRVIDPVSLRHTSRHAITTTRELRVLRETQRHLEHSFVRTFRKASFTTRETSLERQLLYVFRTASLLSRETRRESRPFRSSRAPLLLRWETLLARDTGFQHMRDIRHGTPRPSITELCHRSEIPRARVTAAPGLIWRARKTVDAPPAQGEAIDAREHTVTTRTAQTRPDPKPTCAQATAPFDRANMDRLAEEVISRIERRLRFERERRGL